MSITELTELFISWNKVLFSYFFNNGDSEEDEVSLYIDREQLEKIGFANGLGGYDVFLSLIMLPINERQALYRTLRQRFIGTSIPESLYRIYNSRNLFEFATIYIDEGFYNYLDCPFLIYIVFVIVMASECNRENERGLGNYITKQLRAHFPGHTNHREAWEDLFNELAKRHPRFCARKLTEYPYIGLIYYQLGLTRSQVNIIEKAMYNADLCEELPYCQWIDKIVDYVDQDMKTFLKNSKRKEIIQKRISDLRERFDPIIYERKHQNEEIQSKGHFVLAVFEDEFSEKEDRLVLLTDINNKSISHDGLKISKGTIDRLGEYAEYNVNHVLIGDSDRAQMQTYSIRNDVDRVTSSPLGNIITFTRFSSNYHIQTNYPQNGKETYILVKNGHDDEWNQWLAKQGSPSVEKVTNNERVLHIFGTGWTMYISNEIRFVGKAQIPLLGSSIIMDGGFKIIGKNKVYLKNALPYFVFPEPINDNKLKIYIGIEDRTLEDEEYNYKIVDNNRLVINLMKEYIGDHSVDMGITLEYKTEKGKKLRLHEDFAFIGQDVAYSEDDLFKMNMWGGVYTDENAPFLKGLKVCNSEITIDMPEGTGFYQNSRVDLDLNDPRFYMVNLFTSECSMRNGFYITESRLKKCIRYAATHCDINIESEPTFYTDVKYLLLNSGYMNADFEHGKYQPIPPTFLKTALGIDPRRNLFMLVGSYTNKFLCDLKIYCHNNDVPIYLHTINNGLSKSEQLIPPVILLGNIFDPNDFANNTDSQCSSYVNEDFAVTLLNALPSYADYDKTLNYVPPAVFSTTLEPPVSHDFPRIRSSRATGYNSSKWIEKRENDFYRITIPDLAWAYLYCQYMKQEIICTKDIDKLFIPAKLHLPIMMQRALYILNFGVPQKEKAFICSNEEGIDVYYNIVKRYKINDTNNLARFPSVIHAITGRFDNEQNFSVRQRVNSCRYKLFLWKNRNRLSNSYRSLIVLSDIYGRKIFGIGIKKNKTSFNVYLRTSTNNSFSLIDNEDVNIVFSRIITSNWVGSLLKRILSNQDSIFQYIGVKVIEDRSIQLPPSAEYDIEEIQII